MQLLARGPTRRRVGVRDFEIQWISRFRFRFQDFSLDFRISCWISGFRQDFSLDFRISRWISGFLVGKLSRVGHVLAHPTQLSPTTRTARRIDLVSMLVFTSLNFLSHICMNSSSCSSEDCVLFIKLRCTL